MSELVWLVPLMPLIGFIINGLGYKKLSKNVAALIGCGTVLISFIIAVAIFSTDLTTEGKATQVDLFNWISAGNFHIDFSFLVDRLSILMMLIVTGVGFVIHVYSAGYMHDDEGFGKFFSYMNLFMFSMLVLVLGSNYVMMYIGWEGVALCSYLLIGYWFKNREYSAAANKAFIMNRIGDLGFLLGIFLTLYTFGTTDFKSVFSGAIHFSAGDPKIIAITFCFFVGAMGKSAQIPLYTWLPDAMAGPTPVSALIHAATMVTAGVYMIVRSNILYSLAPQTLEFVAVIGCATALFAALMALTQNDIKKVLAYSTVSQLGYMFAALGVSHYSSGMFHLMTHAFFKALLFLGAGSVIHALGGEQNIRKMGGLRKQLPTTFLTMLVATLAISGFPPFAGFFSKDEILLAVYEHSFWMFLVLEITAVLTAFYMFRMFTMTFFGEFRGTPHQLEQLHESPKVMTIPLLVLMILSIAGGLFGIPEALGGKHSLAGYLAPVFTDNSRLIATEPSHLMEYSVMLLSIVIVIVIYYYTQQRYVKNEVKREVHEEKMSFWYKLSYHKFYVDELYDKIFVKPLQALSSIFGKLFDRQIIDGAVEGGGTVTVFFGSVFRQLQTGNIGIYMLLMAVGIMVILFLGLINTGGF